MGSLYFSLHEATLSVCGSHLSVSGVLRWSFSDCWIFFLRLHLVYFLAAASEIEIPRFISNLH